MDKDIKDILKKYGNKIEQSIGTTKLNSRKEFSREYTTFKGEMSPELSTYERWARSLGSLIKLNVSKKDQEKAGKFISIAHLNIEPWQASTLSVMSFVSVFLLGLFISIAIAFFGDGFGSFPLLFFFLVLITSIVLFYFVNGYPERLAKKWRLKASSQMVPAILYVVVYMRHTPNLEKAIAFAAQHLQDPLALDFKKVFYNVEIGKFSTIKESLDNYLDSWKEYSSEFVEAFHLIESSLFEPDKGRRIITLEKSLQVALDGVYDKMLAFTHTVKSPLTNVYMLGVVLPTLGLALLPLASAMLGGLLQWYHLFILFNVFIPFFVFYLTDKILFLRPGGYGETTLLERNPLYYKYKSKRPYAKALLITLPFFILGLVPLLFQFTAFPAAVGLQQDYTFSELGLGFFGEEKFFGIIDTGDGLKGPFGIGALFMGMLIPIGIALFMFIVSKGRTEELMVEREKTKELEAEFNNSLFLLGNRIGNGVPVESVFGKVAEGSKGLRTEDFFRRVNYNLRQLGMSVERAIFDKRRGALVHYPSDLIATSMRILIEASKKGLKIAAVSLMSISEYVKNIKKITLRLKDMLAEIVSDMKSNMSFLAPLLSGVVVGLAAMISAILSKLNLPGVSQGEAAGIGSVGSLLDIFQQSSMIPPYFLQISIGIYLIQIIFILTGTLVTIDSGEDKLAQSNKTGKNLIKGITLYFIVASVSTFILFILSSVVLGGLG